MEGSLDDIQAERADGTRRLLQVEFWTDAASEWEWDGLTKQETGQRSPKPYLLQKWKASLDESVASGVAVSEAVLLLTDRAASAAIRVHLSGSGLVDFDGLPDPLRSTISAQLRGVEAASRFFKSFNFYFKERSYEALDAALRERFRRSGGSSEGWVSSMNKIRRWISRQDEPTRDGTIALAHVRAAATVSPPPTPLRCSAPLPAVVHPAANAQASARSSNGFTAALARAVIRAPCPAPHIIRSSRNPPVSTPTVVVMSHPHLFERQRTPTLRMSRCQKGPPPILVPASRKVASASPHSPQIPSFARSAKGLGCLADLVMLIAG